MISKKKDLSCLNQQSQINRSKFKIGNIYQPIQMSLRANQLNSFVIQKNKLSDICLFNIWSLLNKYILVNFPKIFLSSNINFKQ